MKRLKLLIAFALLLGSIGFSSQPVGHVFAGKLAWNATDSFCDQQGLSGYKWALKPISAMASHVLMDRVIGEAGLGEYQVDIGVVRCLIGYFLQPEGKERDEYLQYAFWALFPDIIDKAFGTKYFHQDWNSKTIFTQNRDTNELLEELFLAGLIFKWEVKF